MTMKNEYFDIYKHVEQQCEDLIARLDENNEYIHWHIAKDVLDNLNADYRRLGHCVNLGCCNQLRDIFGDVLNKLVDFIDKYDAATEKCKKLLLEEKAKQSRKKKQNREKTEKKYGNKIWQTKKANGLQ